MPTSLNTMSRFFFISSSFTLSSFSFISLGLSAIAEISEGLILYRLDMVMLLFLIALARSPICFKRSSLDAPILSIIRLLRRTIKTDEIITIIAVKVKTYTANNWLRILFGKIFFNFMLFIK